MEPREFFERVMPVVQEACNRWGLYPSIAGAQLFLESKGGNSELAVNANNIAGKKLNRGKFEPYFKMTNEYLTCTEEQAIAQGFTPVDVSRNLYSKPLPFNMYASWNECIYHYCENIMTSKWYTVPVSQLNDYNNFLHALIVVYAPNHPTYYDDILRVVEQYNLRKYDY